jgi:hypothetical protein
MNMAQFVMCDICPFSKSKKAVETWTQEAVDQIEECAEILHQRGQFIPHPCFKNGEILLRPFKNNERPCGGHAQWLHENDSRNK